MTSHYNIVFVDTPTTLIDCLEDISSPNGTHARDLAIDLEGVNLSRDGRIAIIQIVAKGSTTVWIVDVTTLGQHAFNHCSPNGQSLRGILEDANITKLFFDVRNDSDALYAHFGVEMQNVLDLQLLDVASRRSKNMNVLYVSGLARCIDIHLNGPAGWLETKEAGTRLFSPERGGSYEVFEQRPIDPVILRYSAQDVVLLFRLREVLESKIGRFRTNWMNRVVAASASRVAESMRPTYRPHGYHKAFAQGF
ncbi:hypothetical protein CVT24_006603 [Panaeolus cyanescens]|uniref:3'-5' exonuclease domain-containing protein n=1 Tax=Panaeolus cyanescens TaxID=181874 RepID=A0A409WP54_9AGAR|nr:hypothetical protein CVT24_006603 [Panaeolus cyanescens]